MSTTVFEKAALRSGFGARGRLAFTFFGKHPAFADFIAFGSATDTLARAKQTLESAFSDQKRQWEELEDQAYEKLISGFDHWIVWLRPGHTLFGLIWDSCDKVSRRDAAAVCVDVEAVPLRFVLATLRPALESLRSSLQATSDPVQVEKLCQDSQERLTALVNDAPAETTGPDLEARKLFFQRPEFGPDCQGWRRVLHGLGTTLRGASGSAETFAHVRVPPGTTSRLEALGFWSDFAQEAARPGAPVLVISRDGCPWLDVLVGEPTPRAFRCLQGTLKLIPLVTEIPYEVSPELDGRLTEIEKAWLAGGPKRRGTKWLLVAAVVVVLGAVALLMWNRNRIHKQPSSLVGTNRNTPPSTAQVSVSNQAPAVQASVSSISSNSISVGTVASNAATPPAAPETRSNSNSTASQGDPKSVQSPPVNPEVARTLTAASEAEKAGNYTNALGLYWAAQKLNSNDVTLLDRIKDITPKAQAQARAAEEQERAKQLMDNDFRKAMDTGAAAAAAGDYSNAVVAYQTALKIKDDPQTRSALTNAQQKTQETAKKLEETLAAGRKAEDAKDYQAALAAYQAAQALNKDNPQLIERVKILTAQVEEQKRAQAERAEMDRKQTEQFTAAVDAAKAAEQAGNFTNALASYKTAQNLRPDDTNLTARIQELNPKAEQQTRQTAEKAAGSQLQKLDTELEVLMVRFSLLKADQAKTESAKKTKPLEAGTLSMEELRDKMAVVARLEREYKAGGWFALEQRAEKLKKLKSAIQSRS